MRAIVFDWDRWNESKNEVKHGVSKREAESTFFDPQKKIYTDLVHSTQKEPRYILYGMGLENRVLMVGFTYRLEKTRIITARPASKKERSVYEN